MKPSVRRRDYTSRRGGGFDPMGIRKEGVARLQDSKRRGLSEGRSEEDTESVELALTVMLSGVVEARFDPRRILKGLAA